MKDQSSTGETVYKNAAGKKITEAEYRRLQGLQDGADENAGILRGKDEVVADVDGKDAGSGKK